MPGLFSRPAFSRMLRFAALAIVLWRLRQLYKQLSSHAHSPALRHLVQARKDLPPPHHADPGRDLFARYFMNRGRLWIFHRHWLPKGGAAAARGTVFLVHGYAEHSGRYGHVATRLTEMGLAVFAHDHQGHGQSEGDRCHVERFEHYVEDVLLLARHVTSIEPFQSLPRFLMGHSMGGLIAASTALADPDLWSGVMLSGPAFKSTDPLAENPVANAVVKAIATVLPQLPLMGLDAGLISRDEDVVVQYRLDPLVYHGWMRAGWLLQLTQAMRDVMSRAEEFKLPLLMMLGTDDGLCHVEGGREFCKKAGCRVKELREYSGEYHEILNSSACREEVLADMTGWLEDRLGEPEG